MEAIVPLEVYKLRNQLAGFIKNHYKAQIEIDWENIKERDEYINNCWEEIQTFDHRSKEVLYNNMLGFVNSTEFQDALILYTTRRIPINHNLGEEDV